ncbi:MAG: FAD-dependent oxidoreductase [Lachnospiraceae bacterium]|nr:FAD-dependent oxidoreductase [Lachnospiraceae bacterium]
MIRVNQLKLPITHTGEELEKELLRLLRVAPERLLRYEILKRSLDARKREEIHYTYTLDVALKDESAYLKKNRNRDISKSTTVEYQFPSGGKEPLKHRPVICGSGPAGLFAAYFLAKQGFCPIVLERGEAVEQREQTVESFWQGASLNPESNVQFGEGGAGTFSDGKLNTMVKDTYGRIRQVLKTFVAHGAPEEILYLNKPHIGTDNLRRVVAGMRKEILRMGGTFCFQTKLTGVVLEQNQIKAVRVVRTGVPQETLPSEFIAQDGGYVLETELLVLAIGHSARDTFEMLKQAGVSMEAKAFAVGVRVEHEQEMINRNQYKGSAALLPAADYKVTYTAGNGRGIYSFCMCPGGFVVNASSEQGRLVVNGMSNHARDERNANSALIVTVTPEDFRNIPGAVDDPLAGMRFQQYYEGLAYDTGRGAIPWQLYGDLKEGRASTGYGRICPNHKGAGVPSDLRNCLPKEVVATLLEGMPAFDRYIPGFADPETVFSGVEMRTSSPVRMHRNETLEGNLGGLYPCGEGAGYAGGITSAAVDGIKVFEAIAARYCME